MAPLLKPTVSQDDEERIANFIDVIFRFPFLPAFKAIRAAQTHDVAWHMLRPPLFALNDNDRARLLAALTSAGFAMGTDAEQ